MLRSRKGNTATAFGGYPYSEGFVFTDGLLNYTHGYVEIRSTMAAGKGNWPAFQSIAGRRRWWTFTHRPEWKWPSFGAVPG